MTQHSVGALTYFTSPLLPIPHAFSARTGGVSPPPFDTLNLGRAGEDSRDNILENYARFCTAIGVDREALVFTRQVHGGGVRAVGPEQAGEGLYGNSPDCDGLVTGTPGLPLTVFSADCVPILLYDPAHRAVGAVHAGWRGTALGIVRQAAVLMGKRFGTRPSGLRAAIGPAIGMCCFETKSDVPEALFNSEFGIRNSEFSRMIRPCEKPDRFRVDLKAVNAALLADMGVGSDHIDVSDACTCCQPDLFFSHRRCGARRGLQAAVVSIDNI